MSEVDILAKKVWDYMHLNHQLEKADCLLVFGSSDMLPAHRACDLFFEGYAPVIVFSGKYGSKSILQIPEAELYAEIAVKRGVPKEVVFIEDQSTSIGENIMFSKALIEKANIPHQKIIVVQKPYMERRVYAAFKKQWSEPEIVVTSPQISYEEYLVKNSAYDKEGFINRIVGDLIRIREYPKLGFQIEQEIPDDVWAAGQELIKLGYDRYLPK